VCERLAHRLRHLKVPRGAACVGAPDFKRAVAAKCRRLGAQESALENQLDLKNECH
jgi:hypothetical protein